MNAKKRYYAAYRMARLLSYLPYIEQLRTIDTNRWNFTLMDYIVAHAAVIAR